MARQKLYKKLSVLFYDKDKEIIDNRFYSKFKNGKESIDFILTYTTAYNGTIIPYVNTGLTEKGQHITLIKALITKEFNKFFREQNIHNRNIMCIHC